jgi:hypothetical protein
MPSWVAGKFEGEMHKTTRAERIAGQAKRAFASHQIVERSDEVGLWTIFRVDENGRRRGDYWVTIVARHGQVTVLGDIHPITFATYSDSKDILGTLRWIGEHSDVDYYITQKASIGSGSARARCWDAQTARDEICDSLKNGDLSEDLRSDLDDAKDLTGDGAALFWERVSDEVHEAFESGVGMVTAPTVYYAHAAVARLCELLKGEKKWEHGQ